MPKIKTKKEFTIHIQDFIDYCKLENLLIKTIKSYYQTLALFSKYLEEEKQISKVDEVNKNIIEEYLEFTKERGKYSFFVVFSFLFLASLKLMILVEVLVSKIITSFCLAYLIFIRTKKLCNNYFVKVILCDVNTYRINIPVI